MTFPGRSSPFSQASPAGSVTTSMGSTTKAGERYARPLAGTSCRARRPRAPDYGRARPGVRLRGKTALVTGTSRGIGPAIARALAAEGARVLCHARSPADAQELADELGGVAIVGDLATDEGLASAAEQSLAAAPVLHVLVHNAAVNPRPHELFDEVEPEIFREVLRVNVEAPLFLTQALLRPLRAANGARV